jgi:hypothetical protein
LGEGSELLLRGELYLLALLKGIGCLWPLVVDRGDGLLFRSGLETGQVERGCGLEGELPGEKEDAEEDESGCYEDEDLSSPATMVY